MTSLSDFYRITTRDISDNQGSTLLHLYGHSIYKALRNAFPDHKWEPWRFSLVPRNFWSNPTHLRQFFDSLASDLDIKSMDDWYNKLTRKSITEHTGSPHFSSFCVSLLNFFFQRHWVAGQIQLEPL